MNVRPPIVAILGHVDHGKTTLLDFIRSSRLAAREHGGITQSIGAYEIATGIKGYPTDKITFIDTPGHEAFTKLRARGANIADIALLMVDAKDSLMPQTVESIKHIKAAKIPFIVVANKMDLPDARPEKIKNDLLKYEVIVEDKGGDVPMVGISAKTGDGVPNLLESILLLSSSHELTYDPNAPSESYILETKKDKRGTVVGCVIKQGVLKRGDIVYSRDDKCSVRALINDLGVQVGAVEPSTPFELLGFNELPEVGSMITPVEGAALKKETAAVERAFTLDSILSSGAVKEKKLALIVKTDTNGSLEAIQHSLDENPHIEIIQMAVGEIANSDIFLAKASKAIVIGFNIKPNNDVLSLAKQEKVIVKTYNIIYEIIDELTEVAQLIREKEEREKSAKGEGRVLATFIIEGETVYGIRVTKGKVNIGDQAHIYRNDQKIAETRLVSLRNRAKTVSEAKKDQEAGVLFEPKVDIKDQDVVKFIL
jgi:translation initiation factor IF-2